MEQSTRLVTAKALTGLPCGKALVCALILAASIAPGSALADTEDANAPDTADIAAPSLPTSTDTPDDNNGISSIDGSNEPDTSIGNTADPDDSGAQDSTDMPAASADSDSDTNTDANPSADSDTANSNDTKGPTGDGQNPDNANSDNQQDAGGTTTDSSTTDSPNDNAKETSSPNDGSSKEAEAASESATDEQAQTVDDDAGIEACAISGTTFTDVPSSAWYAPYVRWASNQGLVSGYKDSNGNLTGRFGPEDSLTRAELAAMLWRNAGCPSAPSAGFSDTGRHWAKKAIDWCASQGIVTGYSGTKTFGPDDRITREQLCTMLWRNAGYPSGGVSPSRWHDGYNVDDYAWNAVSWAAGQGIMAGTASAPVSLNPQSNATRAEAAKMLAVALGGYEGTSPEHQFLQSLTGWWQEPNSMAEAYYIHNGKIDHYRPVRNNNYAVIGYQFQNSTTLTENDIAWYSKGYFNHGRSNACYAFQYSGNWRLYSDETLSCWWGTPNYGASVDHMSGTGSWHRTSAPTIL